MQLGPDITKLLCRMSNELYMTKAGHNLADSDQKWIYVKLRYHCIEMKGSLGHGWRELSVGNSRK